MSTQNDLQNNDQTELAAQLQEMINGYRATCLIYVAAQLGIADLLKDGPKSSEELARVVGVQQHRLYRVLRVLASIGIFSEDGAGKFQLTPLAELLQAGHPGSQRAMAILQGNLFYQSWGKLLYSIGTGKPSFDQAFQMDMWGYLANNSEAGAIFNQSMTSRSVQEQTEVLRAYNFSGISRIVDVGGGQGSLIAAILKAYPNMQGILFDLPEVVQNARELIQAEGLVERCQIVVATSSSRYHAVVMRISFKESFTTGTMKQQ